MARDRFDDDDNRDDRYEDDRDSRDDRRPDDVRAIAKDKVKGPAITMLISGIITVLMLGYSVVNSAINDPMAAFKQQREQQENDPKLDANGKKMMKDIYDTLEPVMEITVKYAAVFWVLSGTLALTSIVGSIKLMNLSGSGWARAGAIMNLLTCSCVGGCCLIGLPAGIWVLIVLGNADVKAAMNPRPSLEV